MRTNSRASAKGVMSGAGEADLKEIVMGVHWDPPGQGATDGRNPANLDALCVLFDAEDHVLEIVHPGHPRNDNGSVVHTGDSPTGASEWDDERIFVFLEALPEDVASLAFVVASAAGHAFSEIPGAYCHVSDRVTEHEWIRQELASPGPHTTHCVAVLHRGPAGWKISPDTQTVRDGFLAELLSLAGCVKHPGIESRDPRPGAGSPR
jgi:stress response protein SCP2